MKTRWFLRGLGIGIIISALFLCIGYREQSDHNELIKEAKKIGMVFPKEETTSVELAENLNNIQKQEVVSEAAVTTTAETEQEKNSREKIEKSKKRYYFCINIPERQQDSCCTSGRNCFV